MSHGLKLLLIAAGAIITCIVVVAGFQLTKSGKSDTNKASEQFTSVLSEYDQIKLTCYEDMTVSGADVVNYINDNASALAGDQITTIQVKTNADNSKYSQIYLSKDYDTVKEVKEKVLDNQIITTSVKYINPTGRFLCKIDRNENEMITVISFDQQ